MGVSCKEEPVWIENNSVRLFAMLYTPSVKVRSVVVMLQPFLDEARPARMVMVNWARQISKSGAAVILFDLRGTGDSSLSAKSVCFKDWITDIDNVFDWATSRFASIPLTALCVRAGALLSLASKKFNNVILVAPILSGKSLLRTWTLRRSVRSGSKNKSLNELDFDGVLLSENFLDDIKKLNAVDVFAEKRIAVLQVSGAKKLVGEAKLFVEKNAKAESRVIVEEPFWNPVELPKAPLTGKAICEIEEQWYGES